MSFGDLVKFHLIRNLPWVTTPIGGAVFTGLTLFRFRNSVFDTNIRNADDNLSHAAAGAAIDLAFVGAQALGIGCIVLLVSGIGSFTGLISGCMARGYLKKSDHYITLKKKCRSKIEE